MTFLEKTTTQSSVYIRIFTDAWFNGIAVLTFLYLFVLALTIKNKVAIVGFPVWNEAILMIIHVLLPLLSLTLI